MLKRKQAWLIVALLVLIPSCSQPTDSLRSQLEQAEKRAKQRTAPPKYVTSLSALNSTPRQLKEPVGRISLLGDSSDKPMSVKPGQVTLEYIAHACFRIHTPGGKRILIDPYDGAHWLGYNFPKEVAADCVLISHAHFDHDAGTSSADRRKAPWTDEVRLLRVPGKFMVGDAKLTGVSGTHSTNAGEFRHTEHPVAHRSERHACSSLRR